MTTTVKIPTIKDLPSPNADLQDYDRFIKQFDTSIAFQDLWGSDYATNAMDLWSAHIHLFKDSKATNGNVEELLLCVVYHYAAGPYIGNNSNPLDFFCWLIDGIRAQLTH